MDEKECDKETNGDGDDRFVDMGPGDTDASDSRDNRDGRGENLVQAGGKRKYVSAKTMRGLKVTRGKEFSHPICNDERRSKESLRRSDGFRIGDRGTRDAYYSPR